MAFRWAPLRRGEEGEGTAKIAKNAKKKRKKLGAPRLSLSIPFLFFLGGLGVLGGCIPGLPKIVRSDGANLP
jgi:hypothetical protein